MILFLIPVTKIPFGNYYFQCMDDYVRNPFEAGSTMDIQARHILSYGIELHVGFYEDIEHALENIDTFDDTVRLEQAIASRSGNAYGPAYVMTKGFTVEQIQLLLNHMMKKNTRCALYLNSVIGADFTVNPYCANKLE